MVRMNFGQCIFICCYQGDAAAVLVHTVYGLHGLHLMVGWYDLT